MLNLAVQLQDLEKYEEALYIFEDSVDLNKELSLKSSEEELKNWLYIVELKEELGRYQEALEICYKFSKLAEEHKKANIIDPTMYPKDILFLKGRLNFRLGRYDTTMNIFKECTKIIKAPSRNEIYYADSLKQVGIIHCFNERYSDAISVLNDSLNLLRTHKAESKGIDKRELEISFVSELIKANFLEEKKFPIEALKIYYTVIQKTDFTFDWGSVITNVYKKIANLNEECGLYNEAITATQGSLKLLEGAKWEFCHHEPLKAFELRRIAGLYFKLKNFPEAVKYYDEASKILERIEDTEDYRRPFFASLEAILPQV